MGLAGETQYEEVELLADRVGVLVPDGKYLNGAKPGGARKTLFSRFTRYSGEQTQKAVAAYVDIASVTAGSGADGAGLCTSSAVCG
ncbi:hypothetical protein ACNKHS_16985 [Shigella flexneri]